MLSCAVLICPVLSIIAPAELAAGPTDPLTLGRSRLKVVDRSYRSGGQDTQQWWVGGQQFCPAHQTLCRTAGAHHCPPPAGSDPPVTAVLSTTPTISSSQLSSPATTSHHYTSKQLVDSLQLVHHGGHTSSVTSSDTTSVTLPVTPASHFTLASHVSAHPSSAACRFLCLLWCGVVLVWYGDHTIPYSGPPPAHFRDS